MLSRTAQGKKWISFWGRTEISSATITIPVKQPAIAGWYVFWIWGDLRPLARRVICIPFAEEAPPARTCFEKHAIAGRIRRPVSDTVLHYVDVQASSARACDGRLCCARHNFLNAEIDLFG